MVSKYYVCVCVFAIVLLGDSIWPTAQTLNFGCFYSSFVYLYRVEFESKKVAKRLGATLNNTPITNNKRSPNYGDLWNVRYLKGFKWSHLTEKVAYERRVREHKLRIEMMQAKKEHSEYKSLVERGKVMDYIEERRNKRKSSGTGDNEKEKNNNKKKKHFRQNKPLDESSAKVKPVKSAVLSSLVG